MNLRSETSFDEDKNEITSYFDQNNKLHNPNGPAVQGGKSPVFAVHGNIMGETSFKGWKDACTAVGFEVSASDPRAIKAAAAYLEDSASLKSLA